MTDKMTETKKNPDWDRHEWAGEAQPAGEANAIRWSDEEWAGEKEKAGVDKDPQGGSGATGGGHNPSEQHWTPGTDK
jgi:hypothetical protein